MRFERDERSEPHRESRWARRASGLPRREESPTPRRGSSSSHLIDELGFHRLQMEIYGFNERAMRHAERAGFVREGVRRKAYWRNDEWVDGVLYGLVVEDIANE